MATFEEMMQAALNAEQAGDEEAARALVQAASALPGAPRATDAMTPTVAFDHLPAPEPKPDRFGDTISAATEAPRAALSRYVEGIKGGESPTRASLPDNMPIGLKSRIGLAGDVAGAAISGLGTAYAGAAGLVGEALGGSPTNERRLARDLMMMGEVAAPELAGVSGTVRAGGRAATSTLPEAVTDRQRQARAADDLGITPTIGMSGRTGAVVAAQGEKLPIAGNTIANDAARFVGEAESVFDRNVSAIGASTNANSAGSQLQAGLNRFVGRFRERSQQLYAEVDGHIPSDTRIAAPETVARIREALEPFADNPEVAAQLGLDRWARLADDLENGLSWQAARNLRSNIGESVGKIRGPLADMDDGRLKAAYASLTNDLDAAIQQAGPEAQRAWNRANTHYRAGSKRISEQLDRTISADSPERALEAFAAMTRDRSGQANSTRMLRIKNSLSREEWGEVAGTIVDRLGRARDGSQNAAGDVFSPATFLTNWNRMSDEAKRILLPANVRDELHKLAEVTEAYKEAGTERNTSNTGHIVSGVAIANAFYYAPTTTSLAVGGAAITAKAMSSPVFLRATNRAARGDARQLRALANGNGPFADDARTLLRISSAEAATQPAAANEANAPSRLNYREQR